MKQSVFETHVSLNYSKCYRRAWFSFVPKRSYMSKDNEERKKEEPITTIHRARRTKADKDRQIDREMCDQKGGEEEEENKAQEFRQFGFLVEIITGSEREKGENKQFISNQNTPVNERK